jgi:hypothetical protein
MGSNTGIKRKVARGQLCYICEQNPPVLIDEVGGHVCRGCHTGIQNMRLAYALQGGYIIARHRDQIGREVQQIEREGETFWRDETLCDKNKTVFIPKVETK